MHRGDQPAFRPRCRLSVEQLEDRNMLGDALSWLLGDLFWTDLLSTTPGILDNPAPARRTIVPGVTPLRSWGPTDATPAEEWRTRLGIDRTAGGARLAGSLQRLALQFLRWKTEPAGSTRSSCCRHGAIRRRRCSMRRELGPVPRGWETPRTTIRRPLNTLTNTSSRCRITETRTTTSTTTSITTTATATHHDHDHDHHDSTHLTPSVGAPSALQSQRELDEIAFFTAEYARYEESHPHGHDGGHTGGVGGHHDDHEVDGPGPYGDDPPKPASGAPC